MEQTNKIIYDVAVVGAGPAGAIFVSRLAKACPNIKILLIDAQNPNNKKPCGGLLSPSAQKVLAQLDLVLPKDILEDPQIFAVQTIDVEQNLKRYYQRQYLNMDRYAFDKWLLTFVPSHVTIFKGKCTKINLQDNVYDLSIVSDDKKTQVFAKAVVGADGGGSIVRRTFFKPMKHSYVAIQQWFENKGQPVPPYSCIFDSKTSDSCSWTIHKANYLIFGGAFAKQRCREAFDNQKARVENHLNLSFGNAVKTEACLVCSPRTLKDYCTGSNGVFLVGEAAGFISASSFEGLSNAMLSGKLLADAFIQGGSYNVTQKLYKKYTRSLRLKLRKRSVKRVVLCSPILRKIIMKSGVQSIKPYTNKGN